MRNRIAIYACASRECPKIGGKGDKCPTHGGELVRQIYVRETEAQRAKDAADRAKVAARKVDEAAGKPVSMFPNLKDLFG